ncbi:MAG: hypothetical protein P8099_00385 [Gemmatimonadota bacterium]|jgi:hypothetical protein
MVTFKDDEGREWVATAREEDTPRHHGRWYLILHPADAVEPEVTVPEVRWQTSRSAERTLETMSSFELRRRLRLGLGRRRERATPVRSPVGTRRQGTGGSKGGV